MEGRTMKWLVWAKSVYHDGNRGTADDVVTVTGTLPRGESAVAVARQLDSGVMPPGFSVKDTADVKIAAGHGVTVIYDSGQRREVHAGG